MIVTAMPSSEHDNGIFNCPSVIQTPISINLDSFHPTTANVSVSQGKTLAFILSNCYFLREHIFIFFSDSTVSNMLLYNNAEFIHVGNMNVEVP